MAAQLGAGKAVSVGHTHTHMLTYLFVVRVQSDAPL